MTDLALGLHINKKLQQSWNTCGPSSFRFSILEIIDDKYLLPDRELFWIKKTGAQEIGFNVKSDLWKKRTHISVDMSTKKALESLMLGSMSVTIQKLLRVYAAQERK